MKLLTEVDFRNLDIHIDPIDCKILNDQAKILSEIFDEKNKEFCPNCYQNFKYQDGYKYEIVDGKRKRVSLNNKIKTRETGCCYSCAHSKAHFSYPTHNNPMFIHERKDRILKYFNFNNETGFFDLNLKSCILPRQLRSRTCLNHTCGDLRLSPEEKNMIFITNRILMSLKKLVELPY